MINNQIIVMRDQVEWWQWIGDKFSKFDFVVRTQAHHSNDEH